MDVSCPQCKTEYEFEDARIPDDGLTVKCTQCSHVFRMRKQPPELPSDPEESQAGREWRLRQASGTIFNFRRLTTLQKWIVERKVAKADEISLTGESWKRLGDIAELASFFQVVDDAVRAEARASAPPPPPPAPSAPPAPPPPEPPPRPKLTDTLQAPGFGALPTSAPLHAPPGSKSQFPIPGDATVPGQVFSILPPANPSAPPLSIAPKRPAGNTAARSAYRPPADDDDLELVKQGGVLKWVAIALIILGLGGGGSYYVIVFAPQQEQLKAERAEAARQAEIERVSKEQLAAQQRVAADAARARADAEAAARADAGPPKELVVFDAGAVAVPDAGAAAVKPAAARPKDFDELLAEAERMRAKDRSEAALALFVKAAELKPQRVEPHAGGGFVLLDLGKPAEAEATFRGALQVNPRYGPALIGMAEASKALGKKEQAVEYYQKYLDVLPNGTEARVAKANIERLKGP